MNEIKLKLALRADLDAVERDRAAVRAYLDQLRGALASTSDAQHREQLAAQIKHVERTLPLVAYALVPADESAPTNESN